MADRYTVVLDAGTSSPRCFLFDHNGAVVASRQGEWRFASTPDDSPLARELDAEAVWSCFCDLIGGCLQDAGAAKGEVSAVTATSQRQGVVFLDVHGSEVYAGPNTDLRAVFEGGAIDQELGGRVYETTGHTPSMLFAPAKLRWFQAQRPEAYDRIAVVLTPADWLVWRLSGVLVSEPTLAGEAGLLDLTTRGWCSDLLREMGLVDNGHVPLHKAGTTVGTVTKKAARQTGVPAGTPVAASGADTQCGLLGLGVTGTGEAGVVAGWSAPLQIVTDTPILSPLGHTWAGCHLSADKWVVESSSGDAGNGYGWLAETLYGRDGDPFRQMDAAAHEVPVGSEGALAFLGASRMDMSAVGLKQGGLFFPVPLTFAGTGRGHLARASLEAIACAIRANLEQAEQVARTTAAPIALGGGMTRTRSFTRILTDVLGRDIDVARAPQVSAVGAYLCASTAIGEFSSLEQAAQSARAMLTTSEPDPVDASEYESHYERWAEMAGRLDRIAL